MNKSCLIKNHPYSPANVEGTIILFEKCQLSLIRSHCPLYSTDSIFGQNFELSSQQMFRKQSIKYEKKTCVNIDEYFKELNLRIDELNDIIARRCDEITPKNRLSSPHKQKFENVSRKLSKQYSDYA